MVCLCSPKDAAGPAGPYAWPSALLRFPAPVPVTTSPGLIWPGSAGASTASETPRARCECPPTCRRASSGARRIGRAHSCEQKAVVDHDRLEPHKILASESNVGWKPLVGSRNRLRAIEARHGHQAGGVAEEPAPARRHPTPTPGGPSPISEGRRGRCGSARTTNTRSRSRVSPLTPLDPAPSLEISTSAVDNDDRSWWRRFTPSHRFRTTRKVAGRTEGLSEHPRWWFPRPTRSSTAGTAESLSRASSPISSISRPCRVRRGTLPGATARDPRCRLRREPAAPRSCP